MAQKTWSVATPLDLVAESLHFVTCKSRLIIISHWVVVRVACTILGTVSGTSYAFNKNENN